MRLRPRVLCSAFYASALSFRFMLRRHALPAPAFLMSAMQPPAKKELRQSRRHASATVAASARRKDLFCAASRLCVA